MNTQPLICFVAGRSGGHLLPCLTQARYAALGAEHYALMFFTTATSLDKKIISNFELPHQLINLPLENIPYNAWWRLPLFCWHFFVSIFICFYFFLRQRPKKVISMGGYISLPVCIAAFFLRIPIELYELNAIPGKAVKCLAPLARTIFVCFEESIALLPQKKCVLTQYPVRFSAQKISPAHARQEVGLPENKKIIAILGGSQGSIFLNNMIKKWVVDYAHTHDISIIHQTGAQDATHWHTFYQEHAIQAVVFDYTHEIEKIYQAADVIVCRAGAGTLFEICFFGKKCITIPLETKTTDHQKANAYAVAAQHPELVTVVEQQMVEKNAEYFFDVLNKIVQGQT